MRIGRRRTLNEKFKARTSTIAYALMAVQAVALIAQVSILIKFMTLSSCSRKPCENDNRFLLNIASWVDRGCFRCVAVEFI